METWSTIYSKTYNFVYLRAKSIFGKEEDAQQLMKEVYVKAMEDQVNEDRLYSWLGKTVYTLGCSKFRKKNVREAKHIELEEREYYPSNTVYVEKTIDVLCETIEELPDMYQATLYAFYYDHLPIKDIAQLMGYSYKAIVNRLNYIHKYLSKSLQMRASEMEEDIEFSVEMLCEALEEWSSRNRLSANVAQNIYANICRELGTRPEYECNEEEKKLVSVVCDSCGGVGGYTGSFRKQPVNWIILGAESGNRKDKVTPRREWIDSIVQTCDEHNIPVFMKESLRGLMGDDFRQEFPWGACCND